MADHGATVVAIAETDLAAYRAERDLPDETVSCHTAVVEGYVVEGHVPAEAVAKLLADRPDAVGIAVPGMPADSPGMGGDPATWSQLDVLLIERDGDLVPFEY